MAHFYSATVRRRWFTAWKIGGLAGLFYASVADSWEGAALALMAWIVGYVECEFISREKD